jgi:hypothetical protein
MSVRVSLIWLKTLKKEPELVTHLVGVDSRWKTCPQEERSCRSSRKGSTTHKKKRFGLFKSDRENDVFSGALGNAEHTRCIRGVASQMPWKVGFLNDAWSYKKRDRYKRNLEDAIEEKMNSIFDTKFRSYMQSLTQEDHWSYNKLLRIRRR